MKKQLVFLGICFCLLSIKPVFASEINSVNFVSESWENITNTDGTGLCWELFRMVYEPIDIKVKFNIVPYARATRMVQTKAADASVGVYMDEYDQALFSKAYYLQDIVLAIFKKGKVKDWQGGQSLNGKIGWVRGYAFNEYLKNDVKFYEVDIRKNGLKMLEANRLDFFLDTEVELLDALKENYIKPDDYQIETILKLNVHLSFAENERGKYLMEKFDKRMNILIKSGELKSLYKKWNTKYPF